jgi:copper chaperone NosL
MTARPVQDVRRPGLSGPALLLVSLLQILAMSCGTSPPPAAALVPGQVACSTCRMIVLESRLASQLVAPNEEPRFFDDLGCLARYLAETPTLPGGAVAFVADHRTGAWVRADRAVYLRADNIAAPMGSHVLAYETADSRAAEGVAGRPVDVQDVFPGGRVPGGSR